MRLDVDLDEDTGDEGDITEPALKKHKPSAPEQTSASSAANSAAKSRNPSFMLRLQPRSRSKSRSASKAKVTPNKKVTPRAPASGEGAASLLESSAIMPARTPSPGIRDSWHEEEEKKGEEQQSRMVACAEDYVPVRPQGLSGGAHVHMSIAGALRPGSIVLVVGAWGCGKTEAVRHALRTAGMEGNALWWGEGDTHDSMHVQAWMGMECVRKVGLLEAIGGQNKAPLRPLIVDGDAQWETYKKGEGSEREGRYSTSTLKTMLGEWDKHKYNPLVVTVTCLKGLAWHLSKQQGVTVVKMLEPDAALAGKCIRRWDPELSDRRVQRLLIEYPTLNLTALATRVLGDAALRRVMVKKKGKKYAARSPDLHKYAQASNEDDWKAATEWMAAVQLLNGTDALAMQTIRTGLGRWPVPEDASTWPEHVQKHMRRLELNAKNFKGALKNKAQAKMDAFHLKIKGQVQGMGGVGPENILKIMRKQPGAMRIAEHNMLTQLGSSKGVMGTVSSMLDDFGDMDVCTAYSETRGVQGGVVTAGDQDEGYTLSATNAALVRGLSLAVRRTEVRKAKKIKAITPKTSFKHVSPPTKEVHTARRAVEQRWQEGISVLLKPLQEQSSWVHTTLAIEDAQRRMHAVEKYSRGVRSGRPLPSGVMEEVYNGVRGDEVEAFTELCLAARSLEAAPAHATWGIGWANSAPRLRKQSDKEAERCMRAWTDMSAREKGWKGYPPFRNAMVRDALQRRLKPDLKGLAPKHLLSHT